MPTSTVIDHLNPVSHSLSNTQISAHLPELLADKLGSPISVTHQTISNLAARSYAPSAALFDQARIFARYP
ncbi:hypothetical protein QPX11_05415 [Corynebacterium propinquum]|uniref:hypothetical protein n=1 Tax=Corynebacterium propinquum TaxID=43769 RepID=UPI002543F977|nr:hypothetical protein [Corynebacterium propinquum]MDK4251775.1 hypothetical protein [Corynebacterium propinquum]